MGVQFAGNILVQSNGGPLPIANGGTGQTSANAAFNALAPSQGGNSGKVLTTNGTDTSWTTATGAPGGADTQIQFNDSGTFGGNAFLTVNKSTGAITSTSTLTNQGLTISKAAATNRTIDYQTAGSDRWLLRVNSTAESGSNAGSDFEFIRVADNGSTQNQVYTVARSTGVIDFKATPTINGTPISAGAGTVTSVAATQPAAGLTISGSPITTSGTLTFALADDLAALEGLSTAGIAVRTTGSTWTTRTITGTAGRITLTNGDGVSGNPTIDLSTSYVGQATITTLGTITTGTWSGTAIAATAGGTGITSYAVGDILYASSTTALSKLSPGTSGTVLTSNGTGNAPTWSAAPAAAAGTLTGTTLASNVVTSSLTTVASGVTDGTFELGWKTIPQRAIGSATLVLSDSGKHIFNTTASQTYTIPANSSVAYPIGTAITFINQGAGTSTIAINTDTMYLAGAGTTGSRTLAAYGVATAIKITSTSWIISGTGLT